MCGEKFDLINGFARLRLYEACIFSPGRTAGVLNYIFCRCRRIKQPKYILRGVKEKRPSFFLATNVGCIVGILLSIIYYSTKA